MEGPPAGGDQPPPALGLAVRAPRCGPCEKHQMLERHNEGNTLRIWGWEGAAAGQDQPPAALGLAVCSSVHLRCGPREITGSLKETLRGEAFKDGAGEGAREGAAVGRTSRLPGHLRCGPREHHGKNASRGGGEKATSEAKGQRKGHLRWTPVASCLSTSSGAARSGGWSQGCEVIPEVVTPRPCA